MEDENNQFLQQFGGSATANLVTAILFMIYKFIEGRCKHSKCSSNTSCFKCSADNYDTKRSTSNPYNNKEDDIRNHESVQELYTPNSPEVQTKHPQTSQADSSSSRENSRNSRLAKRGEIV